jgi:hypothetical protein
MMPMPEAVLVSLAVGTAAATVITGPLVLYALCLVEKARGERDAAVRESDRLAAHQQLIEEEMRHLASLRLPALLGVASGGEVPGRRHPVLVSTAYAAQQQAVLDQVAEVVAAVRPRAGCSG